MFNRAGLPRPPSGTFLSSRTSSSSASGPSRSRSRTSPAETCRSLLRKQRRQVLLREALESFGGHGVVERGRGGVGGDVFHVGGAPDGDFEYEGIGVAWDLEADAGDHSNAGDSQAGHAAREGAGELGAIADEQRRHGGFGVGRGVEGGRGFGVDKVPR